MSGPDRTKYSPDQHLWVPRGLLSHRLRHCGFAFALLTFFLFLIFNGPLSLTLSRSLFALEILPLIQTSATRRARIEQGCARSSHAGRPPSPQATGSLSLLTRVDAPGFGIGLPLVCPMMAHPTVQNVSALRSSPAVVL